MWGQERHACESASAGGGCNAGEVCVARGEAPYDGAACVFVGAAQACPGGWPNQLASFTGGTDSRGCAACNCTPSGVDCIGEEFTLFDDSSCGGGGSPPVSVTGSTCASGQNHLDGDSASYRATTPTLTGSCTAGGGGPVGAVTPTGPVTFCCL